MNIVDLHVHSNASDGTLSPAELVKEAAKVGLSAFALTDHDTVSGVDEATDAAVSYGIEVIPGVEISTCYKDKEIHIVGLFLDRKSEGFSEALGNEAARRERRNLKLIDRFNEYGFAVSADEMASMFPDSIISRAHFANYMVKKDYVKDAAEAFAKYLGQGMPLYVPKELNTPAESIKLIRSAGGVAVLAHPLLYRLTLGELRALCAELKNLGLVGIETMYSTYRGFDELNVRKLAHEFGLLESGGSDFHGANKPHISLGSGCGNLRISASYMEALRAESRKGTNTNTGLLAVNEEPLK
ncbi:MAG: PHP domain-containing protein [Butyrivibrio sp.]|nr:PHP domain-containing protein [Butyrivibrio sp.]